MTHPIENEHPIVLFDGVCNLCNASVTFIIDRDPTANFRFASLQSDYGKELLAGAGMPVGEEQPGSVVLVEGDRVYVRSTAALRIARQLTGPWTMLYAFMAIPSAWRDLAYRFIARNRYRWFGRREACRVPTTELRARFLA